MLRMFALLPTESWIGAIKEMALARLACVPRYTPLVKQSAAVLAGDRNASARPENDVYSRDSWHLTLYLTMY